MLLPTVAEGDGRAVLSLVARERTRLCTLGTQILFPARLYLHRRLAGFPWGYAPGKRGEEEGVSLELLCVADSSRLAGPIQGRLLLGRASFFALNAASPLCYAMFVTPVSLDVSRLC